MDKLSAFTHMVKLPNVETAISISEFNMGLDYKTRSRIVTILLNACLPGKSSQRKIYKTQDFIKVSTKSYVFTLLQYSSWRNRNYHILNYNINKILLKGAVYLSSYKKIDEIMSATYVNCK